MKGVVLVVGTEVSCLTTPSYPLGADQKIPHCLPVFRQADVLHPIQSWGRDFVDSRRVRKCLRGQCGGNNAGRRVTATTGQRGRDFGLKHLKRTPVSRGEWDIAEALGSRGSQYLPEW